MPNQVYHYQIKTQLKTRFGLAQPQLVFEIQTKWTEFRPNSDHYLANGLNSDRLRKIRTEWQQCIMTNKFEFSRKVQFWLFYSIELIFVNISSMDKRNLRFTELYEGFLSWGISDSICRRFHFLSFAKLCFREASGTSLVRLSFRGKNYP